MTAWYSNHYGIGTPVTSATGGMLVPDSPRIKVSSGLDGAPLLSKHALVDFSDAASMASVSTCRLFGLKSGDRIHEIWVSAGSSWSTGADMDLDLYYVGQNHDGARHAQGNGIFGTNLDIGDGLADGDAFLDNLTAQDRGKALWQIMNDSWSGTFASDPLDDLDLVAEFDATLTVADWIHVRCVYTQGAG